MESSPAKPRDFPAFPGPIPPPKNSYPSNIHQYHGTIIEPRSDPGREPICRSDPRISIARLQDMPIRGMATANQIAFPGRATRYSQRDHRRYYPGRRHVDAIDSASHRVGSSRIRDTAGRTDRIISRWVTMRS